MKQGTVSNLRTGSAFGASVKMPARNLATTVTERQMARKATNDSSLGTKI